MRAARRLVLVLGDPLARDSAAFDGFDARRDAVLKIEAREEATHVPQHEQRSERREIRARAGRLETELTRETGP